MTVVFLHVPKAAGTSYADALSRLVGGRQLRPDFDAATSEQMHRSLAATDLDSYDFVAGHFDFCLADRMSSPQVVTLLRHPIDRLISHYFHKLEGGHVTTHGWRRVLRARNIGLLDFLADERLRRAACTGQITQMAGGLWSSRTTLPEGALLERAQANLESCAHVGIVERLDDSRRLLTHDLDRGEVPTIPHLNSGRHGVPPDLPEELLARLHVRYATEIAFYDWACDLFDRRFAAAGLVDPVASPGRRCRLPIDVATAGPVADPPAIDDLRVDDLRVDDRCVDDRCIVDGAPAVGDWISLTWEPPGGEPVGATLDSDPPIAVVPFDRIEARSGSTFSPGRHEVIDAGYNWIAVPAGVYQVDVELRGRPSGWETDVEWVFGFTLFWCGDPPWSDAPGMPAEPDEMLIRYQLIPRHVWAPADCGLPLTGSGLLRAPTDGGHLCLLASSNLRVTSCAGDVSRLLLVRVG